MSENITKPKIKPYSEPSPKNEARMVKFEIFGEEMLEKRVQNSGRSGRIYLPPDWVGRRIKVIRIE